MRTANGTTAQDAILTACEGFGGKAAECAEVAQDLDQQLQVMTGKVDDANAEIEKLNQQIGQLEEKINQLENQQ